MMSCFKLMITFMYIHTLVPTLQETLVNHQCWFTCEYLVLSLWTLSSVSQLYCFMVTTRLHLLGRVTGMCNMFLFALVV